MQCFTSGCVSRFAIESNLAASSHCKASRNRSRRCPGQAATMKRSTECQVEPGLGFPEREFRGRSTCLASARYRRNFPSSRRRSTEYPERCTTIPHSISVLIGLRALHKRAVMPCKDNSEPHTNRNQQWKHLLSTSILIDCFRDPGFDIPNSNARKEESLPRTCLSDKSLASAWVCKRPQTALPREESSRRCSFPKTYWNVFIQIHAGNADAIPLGRPRTQRRSACEARRKV